MFGFINNDLSSFVDFSVDSWVNETNYYIEPSPVLQLDSLSFSNESSNSSTPFSELDSDCEVENANKQENEIVTTKTKRKPKSDPKIRREHKVKTSIKIKNNNEIIVNFGLNDINISRKIKKSEVKRNVTPERKEKNKQWGFWHRKRIDSDIEKYETICINRGIVLPEKPSLNEDEKKHLYDICRSKWGPTRSLDPQAKLEKRREMNRLSSALCKQRKNAYLQILKKCAQ